LFFTLFAGNTTSSHDNLLRDSLGIHSPKLQTCHVSSPASWNWWCQAGGYPDYESIMLVYPPTRTLLYQYHSYSLPERCLGLPWATVLRGLMYCPDTSMSIACVT
jgi:hypothetical protein